MAMNATQFNKAYSVMPKAFGGKQQVDASKTTMIIEMGPEDFPLIDKNFAADWASPANQEFCTDRFKREGFGDYFGHVKSIKQLQELMVTGWEEGTKKILELSDLLRDQIPVPMGNRRKMRMGDQGEEVDIGRVYSGQLDQAWRSTPRQRDQAPRVISIDADVGHNCNVSASQLFWAGAVAVALTDALEDAGYRVELFSTTATRMHSGHIALTRMCAKRASEPLNPALAAAMVALPATFRWYHLMSWLKHPVNIGYGFGQATAVQSILEEAVNEGILEGAELTLSESLSQKEAVKEATKAINILTGDQDAGEGTMR